jgi:hypothetical protein
LMAEEFFTAEVRDQMKRKWMRLAMEAKEDGYTKLANHYLKAAFVETDTDAALKNEELVEVDGKLSKFKGRSKGPSEATLRRMEFMVSKRAELGMGNVKRFVQDVWDNHADEVKEQWGAGNAETLIAKMTNFMKNHMKQL